jgi:hypothetical protein
MSSLQTLVLAAGNGMSGGHTTTWLAGDHAQEISSSDVGCILHITDWKASSFEDRSLQASQRDM